MTVVHALKWSFLAELASKAITPIVFIVLTRLLTPEDFGVMSAALMVIAFTQIFWEAGMGKALIQRQTDVEDAANVAFWVNLCLGFLIAGLLFWGAQPIAITFFQDARVTAVLQVMTLQVILGALSSVQTALLQKEMNFKKLFWVRSTTVAFPGLASIPLAWSGMGYWALVAGSLTGQITQVLMLWRMSSWRPALRFPMGVARPMGKFGAWVGASGLLAWGYAWVDSLVVGKYLGTHDLGLYRAGNQFVTMIMVLLFGYISPVLYSHLSRDNGSVEKLRYHIARVIKAITLCSMPVAIFLYVYSGYLAKLVFGPDWTGIGFIIAVLGLVSGISWIVSMNGEVYRAMAKPSYETLIMLIAMVIYTPVYLFFIQFGLEVFVWARLGIVVFGFACQLYFLGWVLQFRIDKLLVFILIYTTICGVIIKANFFMFVRSGDSLLSMLTAISLSIVFIALSAFELEKQGLAKDIMQFLRGV